MRIIALGDVFGRPGRKLLFDYAEQLKKEYEADFMIVNCENASGGNGLSETNAKELLAIDAIDVFTSGNHIWDKKDINNVIQQTDRLLRPANYPEPCPGHGYVIHRCKGIRIAVVNLSGTVYLNNLDNPFALFDRIYDEIKASSDIICVDFHAEATSEKIAFGYYADGRASIIFGTHTHVQTADGRVLADGCGYLTDLGMTGPLDGVIGVDREVIIKRFKTQRHGKFEVAKGRTQINGALFDIDETFRCRSVERIYRTFDS